MQYVVTKKYARGAETRIGSYKDMFEAKKIIQEKLAEDAALKVNAIYCLYEGVDVLEEFDQSKLESSSTAASQSSQQGSSLNASPSPFSMSPKPKGMPQSWVKGDDEKKKK